MMNLRMADRFEAAVGGSLGCRLCMDMCMDMRMDMHSDSTASIQRCRKALVSEFTQTAQ